jgi:hypothetical protein
MEPGGIAGKNILAKEQADWNVMESSHRSKRTIAFRIDVKILEDWSVTCKVSSGFFWRCMVGGDFFLFQILFSNPNSREFDKFKFN